MMTTQNNISPRHFFQTMMQVGLNPGIFYRELSERADNYLPPSYFLIICASVNAAASALLLPARSPFMTLLLFLNAVGMPVLIASLLFAITRVVFKGSFEKFRSLFTITAYANITFLFSWIPGIIWFASLWNFYLIGLGMVRVGQISGLKAFICIMIVLSILVISLQYLQPVIN